MGKIVLGKPLTVEEFVEVARFHAEVEFSEEYCERVKKSREIVEKCEGSAYKIQVFTEAEEEIPKVQRIVIVMEEGEEENVLLKETLEAIYHLPEERIEIEYEE